MKILTHLPNDVSVPDYNPNTIAHLYEDKLIQTTLSLHDIILVCT